MEGKPTGLAYKRYNVIVMDSGDDTADYALYYPGIEKFSSLKMNLTICSLATNPEAESRVEKIARRLHRTITWDGQRYIGMIAKELVPFPEKIILIMSPGKRRKQILLKLMRDISPCPPIIVAGTPAESLIDAIELLAHAQIHETEIWVGASWRYAVGVRAVLSQLSKLVPISHILASANSGEYIPPALYFYGTVWRYADLICCIARQAGESEIPEDLCCYHSALYRDSIVMSFAFQGGLIGSLTSTSNHLHSTVLPLNDNLLSITGFERWITLTDSLRKSEFSGAIINELRYSDDDDDYLSRFNLLIKDFISNSGEKNYNASSTSLRSCLPSMWMMDAIRDAIGKKNHTVKRDEIDGEPLDAILKRIDLESLTSTKKLRKMGIAYAKAGQFDLAIDTFAKRIELIELD